jgi:CheY-like chemotaxis protein
MDQPSAEGLEEERRRLWDRRSPEPLRTYTDRRDSDRRCATLTPPADRRSRSDRRLGDQRRALERRTCTDRRRGVRWHDTPTPFTVEQFEELQARFAAPGPVSCPACGSHVSLGPARHTETESARLVLCLGCCRGAVLPDPGTARILVVGANEALRDILRAPLARAGHDVTETADAGVGLAAYEANPADVVLLDVQATGRMGAPEFLRRLRVSSPDARVVALRHGASKGEADPMTDARDLGAVGTIHLPVSREDLLRAVAEARAPN